MTRTKVSEPLMWGETFLATSTPCLLCHVAKPNQKKKNSSLLPRRQYCAPSVTRSQKWQTERNSLNLNRKSKWLKICLLTSKDKMLRKCESRALGIPSSHVKMFLVTTSKGQWSLRKPSGREYIQVSMKILCYTDSWFNPRSYHLL